MKNILAVFIYIYLLSSKKKKLDIIIVYEGFR